MYLPKVGSYSVCSTVLYMIWLGQVGSGQVRSGQVHVQSSTS